MKRINLLPPELRSSLAPSLGKLAVASVTAAAGLAIMGGSYYAISLHLKAAELKRWETREIEISRKLEPLRERSKVEADRDRRLAFIESLLERKNRWTFAFKEFGRVLPKGVWFTGLSSTSASDSPHFVLRGEATSQTILAEFFAELERSKLFAGTTIDYSEKEPDVEPEIFRFQLSVPIRGEAPGGAASATANPATPGGTS